MFGGSGVLHGMKQLISCANEGCDVEYLPVSWGKRPGDVTV